MAVEIIAARTPRLDVDLVSDQRPVEPAHEPLERLVLGEQPDDDGVVLERAHHAAARDGEVDHLRQQRVEGPRTRLVGLGCVERGLESRELDLHRRDDDLFLGLELVVDGRLRHPDRVGDHLQ